MPAEPKLSNEQLNLIRTMGRVGIIDYMKTFSDAAIIAFILPIFGAKFSGPYFPDAVAYAILLGVINFALGELAGGFGSTKLLTEGPFFVDD